jgi:pimeloyl-ACP methyl ester carboxylesterase
LARLYCILQFWTYLSCMTAKNQWKLLAVGLFMAFGRYPISWLISSNRKVRKPGILPSRSRGQLSCSSGNIYYVELDGPQDAQALVFLHGLNASGLQWYYQRAYFRTKYKLVFIDAPGHGKSPLGNSLATEVLAADLAEMMEMLGIRNPVIYGHSMGGMVTIKYAAGPGRANVKGIILQHSGYSHPFKTTKFPKTLLALEHPVLRPYLKFAKRHPVFFRIISMLNYLNGLSLLSYRYLLFSGEQTASQLRFMTRIAAVNPPEGVAEAFLGILDFEATAELEKIEVPALIITADHDPILIPTAGDYLAKALAKGTHQEVDSGHLSLMEHAVELNVMVNDFLESPALLDHRGD